MKPANEKIALHEFAKKFFGIKLQPYQRDMIKLITDGKTKRLKIIPYRPKASPKLRTSFDSLDKILEQGIGGDQFGTIYARLPKVRPTMMIIDDIEAPFRYPVDIPPIQHEKAIVAVKATLY